MSEREDGSRPSAKEISDLKRLASGIVRSQGNRFIKELLRSKGIRIGATKDEFERNLTEAIDRGDLRLADFDEWLQQVEGWGNQHVYLYRLSSVLLESLAERRLKARVRSAGLSEVWNAPTVAVFPEEPTLTSISAPDGVLRVVWQEASQSWSRVPDKDYQEEEGLDLYEYRAWRMVEQRAVTRFEAHTDTGLGGLFIQSPAASEEHRKAKAEAKDLLARVIDVPELDKGQFDVSVISRNLDQKNIPGNPEATATIKTQRSRLKSGGAHVEFAASSSDHAYWEETPIRAVRKSIKDQQLADFEGTGGDFSFLEGAAAGRINRRLRIQLYGDDDRIRLWALMEADEVWAILAELTRYA